MKKCLILLSFITLTTIVSAQVNSSSRYQKGYFKSTTGTYVQPHFKTRTNNTNYDNYSTKGNINTSTGRAGSRAKDYSPAANNYGNGQTIETGSKGGQYYNKSNGNKVYVPKRRG